MTTPARLPSKEGVQPALGFMRDTRSHISESEPATLEGGEEERCCGQTGRFWLSPWKMCWQKPRLGLVLICPCGAMATHQGSPVAIVSLWSLYIKPSFFLHPAGLVCQGHVPVPLPALPQAWQGSMSSRESHGKLGSHLTLPVPIQRTSSDIHSLIVLPQELQLAAKQGN